MFLWLCQVLRTKVVYENLNEPTVRSKPDSSLAKVSWNAGGCGVKSAVGYDALFVGEAIGTSCVEWLGEPSDVACFGEF